jgi:hypothetical protein
VVATSVPIALEAEESLTRPSTGLIVVADMIRFFQLFAALHDFRSDRRLVSSLGESVQRAKTATERAAPWYIKNADETVKTKRRVAI